MTQNLVLVGCGKMGGALLAAMPLTNSVPLVI